MKKVFISQPMRGKGDQEILEERGFVIELAKGIYGEDIEVLDSFFRDKDHMGKPVKCLADSISLLAEADVAVFAEGWENARGCRIEHEVAVEYGIEILEAVPAAENGMTEQRETEILQNALDTYGTVKQVYVAIEECSELQKALTKWLRGMPHMTCEEQELAVMHIREEMADVSIMLNQMELAFGDCTEHEIYKLERLETRVSRDSVNKVSER